MGVSVDHLIKDKDKVHAHLENKGDSVIATRPLTIYFPESYLAGGLGNLDSHIHVVGIFGLVVDNKYYATSMACAMIVTKPSTTNVVEINNEKYMELHYVPGDKVIDNRFLVRINTLVYTIYDEFVDKGKVPWYVTYDDMALLFDTALYHGNANLRADSSLLELIAAILARQPKDKKRLFRHSPELQDLKLHPKPAWIPFNSVSYNTTGVSRLMGGYFNEGTTSMLVDPTKKVDSIEKLLRE